MILTYLCFIRGSLTAQVVGDVLEQGTPGFVPLSIQSDSFRRSPYAQAAIERFRTSGSIEGLEIEGEDGSFEFGGIAGWPTETIIVKSEEPPSALMIESAAAQPGFVASLIGDGDDVFWQSSDLLSTYHAFGRSAAGLPRVYDDVFCEDKIDISANVGRRSPAPGFWLWAASRMWFGPLAFNLIDRDRLARMPFGQIDERSDGVIAVELFDLSSNIVEIRKKQKAFRDWLGFDHLEQRAFEHRKGTEDPKIEVHVGVFPNGGVRRLTAWERERSLVPRSEASERRVTELDHLGHVVFEEVEKVER